MMLNRAQHLKNLSKKATLYGLFISGKFYRTIRFHTWEKYRIWKYQSFIFFLFKWLYLQLDSVDMNYHSFLRKIKLITH